jgi:hypothetical protein
MITKFDIGQHIFYLTTTNRIVEGDICRITINKEGITKYWVAWTTPESPGYRFTFVKGATTMDIDEEELHASIDDIKY